MPSAQESAALDNFDQPPPAATAAATATATATAAKLETAAQDTEDAWGFSASPPKTTSVGKKKKKNKKNARAQHNIDEGGDSSAYPKSITPSPPTDHGVRLQAEVTSQPPASSPPAHHALDCDSLVDLDIPTTAAVDADPPLPPTRVTRSASTLSPPHTRSPNPVAAKPVPAAAPSLGRPTPPQSARDRGGSFKSVASPAPPSQPRRESFLAHHSPRPRLGEAPLPHMPQAHFFGLPDLGIGLGQKQETGKPAGSGGHCLTLDSLADAGSEISAKKAGDALIVGCDGGLEVFRILPNKLEVVGRLEGLRGAVIGAKIVPHTERYDLMQELRPLIVVITHGPMLEGRHDSGPEGEGSEAADNDVTTHFQTTVDVYSLQTQRYLATLYAAPPVAIDQPTIGQVSSLPKPVGDLKIDAQGRFITVTSGKSGEVFVFTDTPNGILQEPQFRCIGKFWTAIQSSLSARSAINSEILASIDSMEEPQRAICSLSPRWLAIVSPSSSSTITLAGAPLTADINGTPPGLSTHAAPTQPAITCEVVGTDIEGAWSRLGRQAAQGLVKVSQRGFEMGRQGWKELTQPSPPGNRPNQERGSLSDEFPPTKAPTDALRTTQEPALVCLVDLDSLLTWEVQKPKYLPPPMATFALLEGCNFVSLSSGGSKLLTSSRKGEVSVVWDLTQVARGVPRRRDATDLEGSTCPSVKQLLRIARNSPSTVLSCAWSKDDDSLALLTAHGTIHLHEVPSRPSSRKRKRATMTAASAAEKADATVSLSTGLSPPSSGFLGSIKSWSQTVSTQVNSIRTTSPASAFGLPTTFAGFREATAAAGNAGSRAVARGLSQGLTAAKGASSDYWHADDNKIRHTKALQEPRSDSSLRWMRRNNTTSIVVACGGTVHVHPVQRVTRRKGHETVSGLKHERYAHKAFPLPPIATKADAAGLKGSDSCSGQGPHGFWSLRYSSGQMTEARRSSFTTGIGGLVTGNDVETNPPFCPFHVGEHVGIYALDELDSCRYKESTSLANYQAQGHGAGDQTTVWIFGEALPKSSKINEHMPDQLRESTYFDEVDEDGDEDVASQMESKLTIQPARSGKKQDEHIRVNTRRKQGRSEGAAVGYDAEMEFSEDDGGPA